MILRDRLLFIQWHDCLLKLDAQLFHFPARKSQNAQKIVFKIDTPVCIATETAICFGPEVHLITKESEITRDPRRPCAGKFSCFMR